MYIPMCMGYLRLIFAWSIDTKELTRLLEWLGSRSSEDMCQRAHSIYFFCCCFDLSRKQEILSFNTKWHRKPVICLVSIIMGVHGMQLLIRAIQSMLVSPISFGERYKRTPSDTFFRIEICLSTALFEWTTNSVFAVYHCCYRYLILALRGCTHSCCFIPGCWGWNFGILMNGLSGYVVDGGMGSDEMFLYHDWSHQECCSRGMGCWIWTDHVPMIGLTGDAGDGVVGCWGWTVYIAMIGLTGDVVDWDMGCWEQTVHVSMMGFTGHVVDWGVGWCWWHVHISVIGGNFGFTRDVVHRSMGCWGWTAHVFKFNLTNDVVDGGVGCWGWTVYISMISLAGDVVDGVVVCWGRTVHVSMMDFTGDVVDCGLGCCRWHIHISMIGVMIGFTRDVVDGGVGCCW